MIGVVWWRHTAAFGFLVLVPACGDDSTTTSTLVDGGGDAFADDVDASPGDVDARRRDRDEGRADGDCGPSSDEVPCDDGNPCTVGDVCEDSMCSPGEEDLDCDDDNECTIDSCDSRLGCAHEPVVSNACRPLITVDFPPRGATLMGALDDASVTVTGSVTSGAGPIESFTLNGEAVDVGSKGAFEHVVRVAVGGNTLVFDAEDSAGGERSRVQSFLFSDAYRRSIDPESDIEDAGLAIWLSQTVVDDSDHSVPPNDLATVFEVVMSTFDINGLLPNPLATGVGPSPLDYDVSLANVTYDAPSVHLVSTDAGLHLEARITNFRGDLRARGTNFVSPDVNGKLTVSLITIDADVLLDANADRKVSANVKDVVVDISTPSVDLSGVIGNLVEGLVNDEVAGFVGDIEDEFQTQIAPEVEPLIADAFGVLAFDATFEIPRLDGSGSIGVELITDVLGFDFQDSAPGPQGGQVTLRAGAYPVGPKGTKHTNHGVPDRSGCGSGDQRLGLPRESVLEVAIADNFINHVFHAAWYGGLLDFAVPKSLLASGDLDSLGIEDLAITANGMLAPLATDCTEKGDLVAFIGDLRFDVEMKLLGAPLEVVVFATLTVGLDVDVDQKGVSVSMTDVRSLKTEVSVQNDSLLAAEPLIQRLIETELVDEVVGILGGSSLVDIPLPEIDLGPGVGLPPGQAVITLVPLRTKRIDGNTLVSGRLQ